MPGAAGDRTAWHALPPEPGWAKLLRPFREPKVVILVMVAVIQLAKLASRLTSTRRP